MRKNLAFTNPWLLINDSVNFDFRDDIYFTPMVDFGAAALLYQGQCIVYSTEGSLPKLLR